MTSTVRCGVCSMSHPLEARFCMSCGAALPSVVYPASPDVWPGQRRLATVLLSDVSGYTSLSERVDAEDVAAVMKEIFASATDIIVGRYGGHIERLLGDAVYAVFRGSGGS